MTNIIIWFIYHTGLLTTKEYLYTLDEQHLNRLQLKTVNTLVNLKLVPTRQY